MSLHIYDSLSRSKREFTPIDPENVRMYVCGMTVYDYCHIGHGRMVVVFDTIARHLAYLFGEERFTYVRNITDVEDKIIRRANENKESVSDLTQRFIDAMHEDEQVLGNRRPDHEPRATQYIEQMVSMTSTLQDRGFAYQADNKDVFYRVRQFDDYGKLSGRSLDELKVGARVSEDSAKDDPLDFVLWKSAKPDEPSWESPWGPGRPGWHIECSAMANSLLGKHFDIHGGGMDLRFPHHENEIAQSEVCNDSKFANYWLHNGYVQHDNEKMSKSVGNFFTIRDVLGTWPDQARAGLSMRYMVLASHYRSPLNYSTQLLQESDAALERLYRAISAAQQATALSLPADVDETQCDADFVQAFNAQMNDDFNTPGALAVLHEIAGGLNRQLAANSQDESVARLTLTLYALAARLGLMAMSGAAFLGLESIPDEILALANARERARQARDWAKADALRDELLSAGYLVEDAADGPRVSRQ